MFDAIQQDIGKIYKTESAKVLASLTRILGDLDLAEEALQEAFIAATEQWPVEGIPNKPSAWLISTGRFKAIDSLRRIGRGRELIAEQPAIHGDTISHNTEPWEQHLIEDEQLRLIFLCCHPQLPLHARIALALREVCALPVNEIARAFLVPTDTIKKRLSRAKALIREKHIPYEIPARDELNHRMAAVLQVIYLVFNEGYCASAGDNLLRRELTKEAIFLNRKLVELSTEPENLGLLALLLLQESRNRARVTDNGDLIPLEHQDRSLWNKPLIAEGLQFLETALLSGRLGPYTLQAAIASVHAQADSVANTQWELIVGYYDMLLSIQASPVIALNRAIALGMLNGPEAGLSAVENIMDDKKLQGYHLTYAAQADFYKQLGLKEKAIRAYQQALERVQQEPEKRYLKKQLAEIL